jgi:hypothetical protein
MACTWHLDGTCLYWYVAWRRSGRTSIVLQPRTKWPVWLNIVPSLISTLWSDFCKKEHVRAKVFAGQWVFTARKVSAEKKCLCGVTNVKVAERHWMLIQRNIGAAQGPHTLMQTESVAKVWYWRISGPAYITKAAVQHWTSLGKEHCREECSNL